MKKIFEELSKTPEEPSGKESEKFVEPMDDPQKEIDALLLELQDIILHRSEKQLAFCWGNFFVRYFVLSWDYFTALCVLEEELASFKDEKDPSDSIIKGNDFQKSAKELKLFVNGDMIITDSFLLSLYPEMCVEYLNLDIDVHFTLSKSEVTSYLKSLKSLNDSIRYRLNNLNPSNQNLPQSFSKQNDFETLLQETRGLENQYNRAKRKAEHLESNPSRLISLRNQFIILSRKVHERSLKDFDKME